MPAGRSSERTQRERSETTTKALVRAARARFARAGYAGTSLDDIAADAGVSKGAVYHHFEGGKSALFKAVYEDEERRLATATSEAFLKQSDALKGLYAGCKVFFEEIFDAGIQRIALIEGPAVLGPEVIREVQQRYSIAQLTAGLSKAMDDGIIAPRRAEPLAHMLFGAVCEAATMTALSDDPRATGRQALKELRLLLDSMRIDR